MNHDLAATLMAAVTAAALLVIFWRVVLCVLLTGVLAMFLLGLGQVASALGGAR